ncbi:hypothetical protein [Streptosporangium saharense]|uniref:Uncharacterized protein n=1 Tax=Streptosporangium saharense TaxID=1706840 RepID=A0A7W7QI68_9ACTN|nr:hypothetical protein [Streptosporangium saharense]MBB4914065.1 hypothetical protein [Streptosporangium saharense]
MASAQTANAPGAGQRQVRLLSKLSKNTGKAERGSKVLTKNEQDILDLITHSPDGESRGLIFRAGDVFPMSPSHHILSAADTPASGGLGPKERRDTAMDTGRCNSLPLQKCPHPLPDHLLGPIGVYAGTSLFAIFRSMLWNLCPSWHSVPIIPFWLVAWFAGFA